VSTARLSPGLPWALLALTVWGAGVARARWWSADVAPAPAPPWQRSIVELSEGQQRSYRAVREGLFEAENRRAATGRWPEPAELAAQGVEPFASSQLLAPSRWTLMAEGLSINYLGVTAELDWLVLILEPDPRVRSPPPPDDEEHHRLPDGSALHVTVWTRPSGGLARPEQVVSCPATRGWTQRVGARFP